MKIDIITNIESSLPKYVISDNEPSQTDSQEKSVAENIVLTLFEEQPNQESFIEKGEYPEGESYIEGSQKTIVVNAYERNPALRRDCLRKYGTICSVCKLNFEEKYGVLGKDFIEVHHLIPLKDIRHSYEATADDLRPVCSNCHSMLHRNKNHNLTIEELKIIYDLRRDVR